MAFWPACTSDWCRYKRIFRVYIKPTQPTLFDGNTFDDTNVSQHFRTHALSHRPSLSAVTDALKDKYGADAVRFGRDLRFEGRISDTMPTGKDNT